MHDVSPFSFQIIWMKLHCAEKNHRLSSCLWIGWWEILWILYTENPFLVGHGNLNKRFPRWQIASSKRKPHCGSPKRPQFWGLQKPQAKSTQTNGVGTPYCSPPKMAIGNCLNGFIYTIFNGGLRNWLPYLDHTHMITLNYCLLVSTPLNNMSYSTNHPVLLGKTCSTWTSCCWWSPIVTITSLTISNWLIV